MGQRQKSERAIQVAFNLAPENRIILRAIAQFYAHFGDFDQALFFLRKSPLVRVDPWILSSEIALSNEVGRTSKNIKIGQKMILDKNFHPLALSELSSELGTMDFISGNSKQGKRKFELATIVPYENAVAQIVWVNKYLSALEMAKKEKDLDLYYRALLCLAREEKRIRHPISELIQQIEDQKYSFYRKQYNTVINNFQLI